MSKQFLGGVCPLTGDRAYAGPLGTSGAMFPKPEYWARTLFPRRLTSCPCDSSDGIGTRRCRKKTE